MKNKKIILALALTVLLVCSMSLALTANADTTTVPTDLRNVKVGDDLSGATIYVDFENLSTSFRGIALQTSTYYIYREGMSGMLFGYKKINGSVTTMTYVDFNFGGIDAMSDDKVWKKGGERLYKPAYTLPSDFGKVTSVNDASMLFVSASEFSAFKGKTFDDGIPVYAGLELKNTMFAVKKPTFTKTFVQMSGSSDLVRVNLFTTTYSQLIRTNADDIILRYSTNGGMTFTEKYLWNSMSNTSDDIVYFEYDGYGVVSASNFLSETTSWLRVVTLEKYTIKFVDQYGNDSSTVTKNRGETISLPYTSQPTTPLMTYSWVCDKNVSDYHVTEDRVYTKTMYINGDKVLTDYIGNVKTLNDGFPSSLKFYLVQRSNKYGVYVGISDLQNIISDKVLEGDKTTSKFVLKLHSLKTDEQNTNYLQARMTYDQVVDSTVGAKDDLYWYLLDDFTEEVGTFTPSSFAQVQLTVTMTFDEVIFDGNVTVPVQIYGNVTELRNVNIEVPCKKYYNGDIDLKLPVNFWTDYPELQVDDILIHKFVFEQIQNTNWILSDGYYVAKTIDTLSLKQETSDFTFTNNINDKTMSFPVNIDADGNYYVTVMLDNPLQVNSKAFLANNGWRDKFDGMSTLTDLRYCTDEAKAFIRSMLLCDNYANYNFGESGYYITGLPGHTVYSNTVGDISSVVGIKVYITTPMLTEYGKTYRLTLVSEEEYTKEESKIPQNWFDEVWNGVSGTGNSVFNGIKTVLCIVLAIVVVIVFAKLTSALVYRIQHGAKRRKRK